MTQNDLDRARLRNFEKGVMRLRDPKGGAFHGSSGSLSAVAKDTACDEIQGLAIEQMGIAYAERMACKMFGENICESPLEELFWAALVAHAAGWTDGEVLLAECRGEQHWSRAREAVGPTQLEVCRQHVVGDYRIDFFLTGYDLLLDGPSGDGVQAVSSVFVECDGHDFHERTKEQAKRDRKRDRELQKLGIKVFRFTGSEIFADPLHCAAEAFDAAFTSAVPAK
jgi:very-short-patch-repair endonuclease